MNITLHWWYLSIFLFLFPILFRIVRPYQCRGGYCAVFSEKMRPFQAFAETAPHPLHHLDRPPDDLLDQLVPVLAHLGGEDGGHGVFRRD